MNAILTATIITILGFLDYFLPHLEEQFKIKGRAKQIKLVVLVVLILVAWGQALYQMKNDREADRNMVYLKAQLGLANRSLTNTTTILNSYREEVEQALLAVATNVPGNPATLAIRATLIQAREHLDEVNTETFDPAALATVFGHRMELENLKRDQARAARAARAASENESAMESRRQEGEKAERLISSEADPVFEYAVKTLHAILTERAKKDGEKLFSTFTNMPPSGTPSATICRITNGTNSPWIYDVWTTADPRCLNIRCIDAKPMGEGRPFQRPSRFRPDPIEPPGAGGVYRITLTISPDITTHAVSYALATQGPKTPPGSPLIEGRQPASKKKELVDSALKFLIGAHAYQIGINTNN